MKIYSDGYCINSNPSKIGGGFTVVDAEGKLIKTQQILKSGFTNNEAELLGCIHAMEIANDGDTVSTDSQNTIAWILGSATIPRKNLKWEAQRKRKDLDEVKKHGLHLMQTKKINLIFEPRDLNKAGHYNEFVLKKDGWVKKYDKSI